MGPKAFTQRYHKIKQTLQEIAEGDLRIAEQIEHQATRLLEDYMATVKSVCEHRARQINGADWLAWEAHATLWQLKCKHQEADLTVASEAVIQQRRTVHEAYREKKRFEALVTQQQIQRSFEQAQAAQKEADEHAALRYTRR